MNMLVVFCKPHQTATAPRELIFCQTRGIVDISHLLCSNNIIKDINIWYD